MSDDGLRALAEKAAVAWAERLQSDPMMSTIEEETVATVLLDMRTRLMQAEADLKEQRGLARNLGADMLYALEAAYVDEPEDDAGERLSRESALELALLYLARGWKREGERIWLHDCTEGLAVTANLPDTSAVE